LENERKPLEVEVASPTGFCFGVKRAIESLEKCIGESAAAEGAGKVYSIGMPIHNPQEVARLSRKGLVVVERIEDVPSGARAFVRAHGVHPSVKKALLERCGGRVTDATCPFVKNAQEKAALLAREGYSVLVLGDPNHPEVQAIVGCAGEDVSVASSLSEVKGVGKKDRLGVISQTTQKKGVSRRGIRGSCAGRKGAPDLQYDMRRHYPAAGLSEEDYRRRGRPHRRRGEEQRQHGQACGNSPVPELRHALDRALRGARREVVCRKGTNRNCGRCEYSGLANRRTENCIRDIAGVKGDGRL